MLMPFGQYKDTPVMKLPLGYLLWLRKNVEIRSASLLAALSEAYEARVAEREAQEKAVLNGLDPSRLAEVTIEDVWEWWKYFAEVFRRQYYDVQLERPDSISFMSRRWELGLWWIHERRIQITNRYILPYDKFQNILLHEMCHQYITDMRILDTSSHGRRWQNIAARMGAVAGHHITIVDDGLYAPSPLEKGAKSLVVYLSEEEANREGRSVEELEATYEGFQDDWRSEFI